MWKIWFDDVEVEGSSFEEWQACKNEGVVGIYVSFGRGEDGVMRGAIFSGSDWYWMTPDGVIHANNQTSDDPGDWVDVATPSDAVVKSGLWVSDERMNEFNVAVQDLVVS
jgi:hypothetical protein